VTRSKQKMTSSKPYLIRAIYEWLLANDQTPYILIDAMQSGVEVPVEFVNDGKIVLNISPTATQHLNLENKYIEFDARFGGIPTHVYAPTRAVMAIYSKENNRGMVFSEEEGWHDDGDGGDDNNGGSQTSLHSNEESSKPRRGRPKLKVIK